MSATTFWMISLAAVVALAPGKTAAQVTRGEPDQKQIASRLLARDRAVRSDAIAEAALVNVMRATPEFRAALLTALEHANSRRSGARRAGLAQAAVDDPESYADLVQLVVQLKEPRTVPALAASLGIGMIPIHALAEFGEDAAAAVLRVIAAPESDSGEIVDALIVLRFIMEKDRARLSPQIVAKITSAAQRSLEQPTSTAALWTAIDLAVGIGDANLTRTVENLANDEAAVAARGVRPDLIEPTQRRAAERLAGVPALPRRQ